MEFIRKALEGTPIYEQIIVFKTQFIQEFYDNKYWRYGIATSASLGILVLFRRFYLNYKQANDMSQYEVITHDKLIERMRQNAENNDDIKDDIKDDTENTDKKDDDDDEQENDEEEEKESLKLQLKLQKHKLKMKRILIGLVCVDVGLSCLLAFPYHDVSLKKDDLKNIWRYQRLFNFKGDTFDCFVGSLIRISVFIGMVNLNVLWGNVEHYKEIQVMDKKAGNTKEIAVWDKLKGRYVIWCTDIQLIVFLNGCYIIRHFVVERINSFLGIFGRIILGGYEKRLKDAIKNEEEMEMQLQEEISKHSLVLVKKDKSQKRKTMDSKEIIERFSGAIDIYELSRFYKSIVWIGLFTSLTVFQSYVGIKLVFFDGFKKRYNKDNILLKSIGIFSSIIVLSHMQTYFGGKYIDDSCEPKNKFFNDKIHAHPMFKRKKAKSTWCSLCWDKIHGIKAHYHCPSMLYIYIYI